MALSWNEIKSRAVQFSKEWEDETSEDAEAKSFLDGFFNVFGITRRRTATFEFNVIKSGDRTGYIDLLWKGVILIEQKSRGKDLDKAYKQATEYFSGLKENELPKYILVCDFERFRLYDLEESTQNEFHLKDLYKNVKLFGFIAGYQKQVYKPEDPVNIHAAELMGKLHDMLKVVGYTGHQLELYLVRLLFCLFADDTTIFDKGIFEEYIRNTKEDGSDLADRIAGLFEVLNTDKKDRLKNIDEALNAFPYVNGKLFEENLHRASFDSKMRKNLLDSSALNWGKISPAIFGSMFQSVMNPQERRTLGAHYTSEKNIQKLIRPLFLDELYDEFEKVKGNRNKLTDFHKKLSTLKFLDPACGCGNFLVITYRELRLLEMEVIKALHNRQQVTNVNDFVLVDINQFYGIEYEEWPAQIAQVAMWLIDHQMNMKISEEFGEYFVRLPLKKSAAIVHGNALRIDWQSLLNKENEINIYAEHANIIQVKEPKAEYKAVNVYAKNVKFKKADEVSETTNIKFDYIMGNPPFIGSKMMKQEQRNEIKTLFVNSDGSGVLDYVCGWYVKAAQYIQDTKIKVAFVSTNSIAQGEQVGALWKTLLLTYGIKIHFAHRTFKWSNEARGNAAVYCVIIGFANYDIAEKRIYEYDDIKGEPHERKVKNINPYLIDGRDIVIENRSNPLCNVPKMSFGNMPLDGGNLLLSNDEKNELLSREPSAKKYIKPLISAQEFLNGGKRWCIWLVGAEPSELKRMPKIIEKVEAVRKFRLNSIAPSTQKFAASPTLFRDLNQPDTFIVIPRVSSENREYIPMGFFDKNSIVGDTCMSIPNGNLYHFGVLNSQMHMAWVKYVCGRLKSDFRYSKFIVYNNYPWPENPTDKQKQVVEDAAQRVLDVRSQFPNSSLADLYDPLTMPPVLSKAHQELDKAVDKCYRPAPFESETKRIEYLFELYEKYTAGLFAGEGKKKQKRG